MSVESLSYTTSPSTFLPIPMDPFPWDSLPTEIQQSILSLLPVSTLIACTSVSRSLRSTIRSPIFTSSYKQNSTETIFLFSDWCPTSSVAYNSSSDGWSSIPVPPNVVAVQFSHGPSVLAQTRDDQGTKALLVFNPLRPNLNPRPIPPTPRGYNPLAFFTLPDSPTAHFKIVALTNCNYLLRSQVYDSALGEWRFAGEMHDRFWLYGGTVFMEDDGLFYCVSRCPECILSLDIATSKWSILNLNWPAPSLFWPHLFGFSGRLFFSAAIEETGEIDGVGVWELDRTAMEWSLACFMPDEQFVTFSMGGLENLQTIDCGGVVCFYHINRLGKMLGESMMMWDVLEKRWWKQQQCLFPDGQGYHRHAVEPCIDLVWGSN